MCVGYVFAFLHQYMVKICANNMFSIFFRVTTRILSCLALFHHLMGNLFHRITRASKNAQKKRMFFGDFAKSWKGGIFLLSSLFQGVSEGSHPPTLWVSVEPPWQKAVCASIRYIPLGRLHQRPQESLDERIKWYVVEVLGKLPSQFGSPISPEGSLPIRIDLFKEKSLSDAQESWSNIRANAWGVA